LVTGCVVQQEGGASPDTEIKPIEKVLDPEPFLPPSIVSLCQWVADYYLAGIGNVVAMAMPPGARRHASSFKTARVVAATAHGLSVAAALQRKPERTSEELKRAAASEASFRRELGRKQLEALEMLAANASGLPASALRECGIGSAVVARLAARGLAVVRREHRDRDPFERDGGLSAGASVPDRALTGEQASALKQLLALVEQRNFQVALLHGVTGSGKTEVYLRLADVVCRSGRQALMMVPEIALTPSLAAQLRAAFGARVAVQHSALSDGERHDQWQRIRAGDVDVVVGTRSAVFAPLTRLGLVIVDEEHDSSYKQEESPRYHGRDVAVLRASREGALVVLGSATPSMESYHNALTGKYLHIALERRVLDRPLASVRLVNMRAELTDCGPDVIISRDLAAAIADRLSRREQILVLLNRRGYSTAVFCRQCGDTFECPNCSVSLTVHRAGNGRHPAVLEWRARCHYCNYSTVVPKQCRKCAAPYLEHTGFGTAKVEQHLRDRFPNARIGRIDRDSVRRRGVLTSLLTRFGSGELDMLVGTQMIAKGHDFPHVTLVGVISADIGLGLADFRAAERTFQLLTQVAGRAGRGEDAGEAIVQTLFPGHYSIQLACRQDYPAFFEKERTYRRGMRYPPFFVLINTLVRGRTFDDAMSTARNIVSRLERANAATNFIVLGPAPAPLGRLRGEHRVQFFLKGTRRADMRQALRAVLSDMPHIRRRVTLDVDPLSVL
jgi:primosomal protein N' (replication factor Y)